MGTDIEFAFTEHNQ